MSICCLLYTSGKAEGKAEGEAIGETRMRMLINRLIADGRMDEIGKIIDLSLIHI